MKRQSIACQAERPNTDHMTRALGAIDYRENEKLSQGF
jgi:hypothetical protein